MPTYNNYTSLWFNHSWPADAIRIYMGIGHSSSKNQIIQDQTVDENLVTDHSPSTTMEGMKYGRLPVSVFRS